MPSTLVTGANSFVAAHIVNSLIAAGHHVTGTVRRASSGDDVLAAHHEGDGKVDIAVVGDYAKEESWDELFKKNTFDHVGSPPARIRAFVADLNRSSTWQRRCWTRTRTTTGTF